MTHKSQQVFHMRALYILDINSRQTDKNKQKPANQRQILNSLGRIKPK